MINYMEIYHICDDHACYYTELHYIIKKTKSAFEIRNEMKIRDENSKIEGKVKQRINMRGMGMTKNGI